MAVRTTVTATPLAYRVKEAAQIIAIGEAKFWQLISSGRIEARRIDGATIITQTALMAFIASTPVIETENGQIVPAS